MSKEEYLFLKDYIPEEEHFRINNYLAVLTIGQKEQIKIEKRYLLHYDLNLDNHNEVLLYFNYLSEDYEDSPITNLLVPFIKNLQKQKPSNNRIKAEIKCSGLSIISLSSVLYTLWKNDILLSDKNDFKKFVTGLFSKVSEVE